MSTHDPNTSPSKQGRCPRCGNVFHFVSVATHKPFPFCSNRCRDIDLGNWFSGQYAIPGAPAPQPSDDPDARLADDGT